MKLTETERLILFNQYLILKKLAEMVEDEDKDYYSISDLEKKLSILSNGFELEYEKHLFNPIKKPVIVNIQNFILEVLEMFVCIQESMEALTMTEREKIENIDTLQFVGFSKKQEPKLKMYLDFIRETGRFSSVFEYYMDYSDDFDSKRSTVIQYEAMLEKFYRMPLDPRSGCLSFKQLQELANVHY